MSGPRSRDEDATLGEQKGSPREGSTADLERFHSGRRKGGPEETTRMPSHAILEESGEYCWQGRVLLYRDETCTVSTSNRTLAALMACYSALIFLLKIFSIYLLESPFSPLI